MAHARLPAAAGPGLSFPHEPTVTARSWIWAGRRYQGLTTVRHDLARVYAAPSGRKRTSGHRPFALRAEFWLSDRNTEHGGYYSSALREALEPNPPRPASMVKTKLKFTESDAGQISPSPRTSFTYAILSRVALKLLH